MSNPLIAILEALSAQVADHSAFNEIKHSYDLMKSDDDFRSKATDVAALWTAMCDANGLTQENVATLGDADTLRLIARSAMVIDAPMTAAIAYAMIDMQSQTEIITREEES
jgi:hypothetical protein